MPEKALQPFSWDTLLKVLFVYALVLRFLIPVYDNPMENLFSDPARHWENGKYFLTPTFIGGIDPKLYQLYVWLLQVLTSEKPAALGVVTGLLSAFTGWVWYRVCRELFTRRTALIAGIVLCLHPSLNAIYTLFMNETLLLPLMGAGFWLSLRAARKGSLSLALAAAAIWVLACYTRLIALPLAVACLGYLLAHLPRKKWQVALFTLLLFAGCAFPAGWHSYQKVKVIAPFGLPYLAEFYYFGHQRTVRIDSSEGVYSFSSPSFYYSLGEPVFTYEYCRPEGTATAVIYTPNGRRDWEEELRRVKDEYDFAKYRCDFQDNLAFLLLGASWPDSAPQSNHKWLYHLNFELRWLWSVLMVLLLAGAPCVRRSKPEMLIAACALGMLLLLIFQQAGVMEGRYRKPLEPLLILFAFMLGGNSRREDRLSLWRFIKEIYLIPLTRLVRKKGNADAAYV